jgi:hypothetical protein
MNDPRAPRTIDRTLYYRPLRYKFLHAPLAQAFKAHFEGRQNSAPLRASLPPDAHPPRGPSLTIPRPYVGTPRQIMVRPIFRSHSQAKEDKLKGGHRSVSRRIETQRETEALVGTAFDRSLDHLNDYNLTVRYSGHRLSCLPDTALLPTQKWDKTSTGGKLILSGTYGPGSDPTMIQGDKWNSQT